MLKRYLGLSLFGALLLGGLSGCGDESQWQRELPQADAVLQLMHAQDPSILQIKLQQCQVHNQFAGQEGTSAKYDIYTCKVMVEHFDDEYQQSYTREDTIDLRPYDSETGWLLMSD